VLALDPRVVDAVWAAGQGHLPPRPPETHPLGCHRPRIPDRDCFTAILLRLVTGCSCWSPAAPGRRSTTEPRRQDHPAQPAHRMAQGRRVHQAGRRIARRLRQDHRPGPVRSRRRRQPAQSPPAAQKGPAPTPPTAPTPAGSGRSPPTGTGSRSAGSSTAPTATTPSCSRPPCTPSPTAACSPTSRRCTWTAATTAFSSRNAAKPLA